MARDYNEQAPDGSWRNVKQDDSGKYTVTPIPTSGQAAAGIPGGGGGAGSATSTADQLAGLDSAAGGHWDGNRNDPAAVASAYAAAGSSSGDSFTGWNGAAATLAEQVAQNKATMAYNYATLDFQKMQYNTLSAYQKEQMAVQKAQDAWSQSYQESQQKWTQTYQQAQLSFQQAGLSFQQYGFNNMSAAEKSAAAMQQATIDFTKYAHDTQSADQAASTAIQQGTLDYTKYAHDTQSADQTANSAQAQADLAYQKEHDQALIDFQNVQFNNMSADQKEQAAIQRAQQAGTEKYQQAQIDLQKSAQSGYTDTGAATLESQRLAQDTAIRQGTLSGYTDTGNATLDRQKMEQDAALGMLNVAKDLRGPRDMFAYQNVLGNAPQGLRSVLDAVAGKYQMGTGAATGTTPMANNTNYLVDDIQNGGLAPSVRPGGANAEFAPAGAAQQATLQAQAYGLPSYQQPGATPSQGVMTTDQGMNESGGYTYPPYQPPTTQTNPALAQQVPKNTIPNELAKPVGTSPATPAGTSVPASFTAPGQWSPTAMNQLAPVQKDALMAYNENSFGWRPEEQQWAYTKSLPKYGGPKTGSVRTF